MTPSVGSIIYQSRLTLHRPLWCQRDIRCSFGDHLWAQVSAQRTGTNLGHSRMGLPRLSNSGAATAWDQPFSLCPGPEQAIVRPQLQQGWHFASAPSDSRFGQTSRWMHTRQVGLRNLRTTTIPKAV